MSRPIVFVFPGQSSRDRGMFDRIDAVSPGAGTSARERAEVMSGRRFDGTFSDNLSVQCSVFEADLAYVALAESHGLSASASAGLSLGEYAHLVEIEALSESGARSLVRARGLAYDNGPSGAMAAVHPIDREQAQDIARRVCDRLADAEAVAVSNFNSPTQCVFAGSRAGVDAAMALADEELFASGAVIEERIPMHVARFRPALSGLAAALSEAKWQRPRRAYWPNVDATPIESPDAHQFISSLSRHVHEPVMWRDTVDRMVADFGNPVFVEVGPRQVLTGLMGRRWLKPLSMFALDLLESASPEAFRGRIREIADAAGA